MPHEGVDFSGKRVAVIGTGSSGIQSIPLIAEQASQLFVFQRTPNFSLPANNAALTPARASEHTANFQAIKAQARHTAGGRFLDSLTLAANRLPVPAAEMPRLLQGVVRLVSEPPGR